MHPVCRHHRDLIDTIDLECRPTRYGGLVGPIMLVRARIPIGQGRVTPKDNASQLCHRSCERKASGLVPTKIVSGSAASTVTDQIWMPSMAIRSCPRTPGILTTVESHIGTGQEALGIIGVHRQSSDVALRGGWGS